MDFIRKIFHRRKKISAIDDTEFGRLTFDGDGWHSIPPNSPFPFMIGLRAPQTGPTALQREFFKKIFIEFQYYVEIGLIFINRHRSAVSPLSVYSLELPNDNELTRGEFVIEYASDGAAIIYRAVFMNWEPTYYGEDD